MTKQWKINNLEKKNEKLAEENRGLKEQIKLLKLNYLKKLKMNMKRLLKKQKDVGVITKSFFNK